jgi:putative hydrolase of the HAD superfamily
MKMHEQIEAGSARIEAVLFDYGLVLTGPPDPIAWEEMRAILGVPEPEFHAAYWRHRHDYDRGALNGPDYWHAVARDLKRQMIEPQLSMVLEADVALWTRPNPPMIAWATTLQAAGVRTGILSNLGDAMEEGVLRRCVWMGGFSHHTFSHRLRMAKPEAAIYQAAVEGLGVSAEAVLFIDDREENIRGAIEAGMQAIQYVDHEQFLREFRERSFTNELPQPGE